LSRRSREVFHGNQPPSGGNDNNNTRKDYCEPPASPGVLFWAGGLEGSRPGIPCGGKAAHWVSGAHRLSAILCRPSHLRRRNRDTNNIPLLATPRDREIIMSIRKLQIALFAAIAAVGLATAPVTAAAGPTPVQQGGNTNDDEAAKPKQGKSSNSKYGNKQDKDDDSDKWEKLRRQMQYKMMQYKKQYENKKQYETTASAKPAQAAYQKPAQAANTKTAAAKPATPAAGPCNCLTKEYTGDGKVVFKDICTKEVAVITKEAAVNSKEAAVNSKDGEKN